MSKVLQVLRELRQERSRAQREVARLNEAITVLQKLTRTRRPATKTAKRKPRRKLSVAARKKIAAAQKARWSKVREQKAA